MSFRINLFSTYGIEDYKDKRKLRSLLMTELRYANSLLNISAITIRSPITNTRNLQNTFLGKSSKITELKIIFNKYNSLIESYYILYLDLYKRFEIWEAHAKKENMLKKGVQIDQELMTGFKQLKKTLNPIATNIVMVFGTNKEVELRRRIYPDAK